MVCFFFVGDSGGSSVAAEWSAVLDFTLPWKRRILVDQGRKVKQASAIDCEGKR